MLRYRDIKPIKETPRPKPRLGYFHVSAEVLQYHWDHLLIVMPHIVPLQVEYRADLQAYRYLAHSELFEPSDYGVVAPEYEIIFTRVQGVDGEPDTFTFEFKKRASSLEGPL